MIINLNGGVSLNGEDIYFDELEIEIDDSCEIEEYEMDCDECGFYEDEEDDDEDYDEDDENIDEKVDELTSIYADILSESCICPECIKDTLKQMIRDFVSLL